MADPLPGPRAPTDYDSGVGAAFFYTATGNRTFVDPLTGELFQILGSTRIYSDKNRSGQLYVKDENGRRIPYPSSQPLVAQNSSDVTQRPAFATQGPVYASNPGISAAKPLYPSKSPQVYQASAKYPRLDSADESPALNTQSKVYGSYYNGQSSTGTGLGATVPSLKTGQGETQDLEGGHHVTQYAGGVVEHTVADQSGQINSHWMTGPAERMTEAAAYSNGFRAFQMILGTSAENVNNVDSSTSITPVHVMFYSQLPGYKVFEMMWATPLSAAQANAASRDTQVLDRSDINVRKFIVVRPGDFSSIAVSICTYGGRGVAVPGVRKCDHAVVYSRGKPIEGFHPHPSEAPARGEYPMRAQLIRVSLSDREDCSLHAMSRINFAPLYSIQNTVNVKDIGVVHRESMGDLQAILTAVQTEVQASYRGAQEAAIPTPGQSQTRSPPAPAFVLPAMMWPSANGSRRASTSAQVPNTVRSRIGQGTTTTPYTMSMQPSVPSGTGYSRRDSTQQMSSRSRRSTKSGEDSNELA